MLFGIVIGDGFDVLNLLDIGLDLGFLFRLQVFKHHFVATGITIMKLIVHNLQPLRSLRIFGHIRVDVVIDFHPGREKCTATS